MVTPVGAAMVDAEPAPCTITPQPFATPKSCAAMVSVCEPAAILPSELGTISRFGEYWHAAGVIAVTSIHGFGPAKCWLALQIFCCPVDGTGAPPTVSVPVTAALPTTVRLPLSESENALMP